MPDFRLSAFYIPYTDLHGTIYYYRKHFKLLSRNTTSQLLTELSVVVFIHLHKRLWKCGKKKYDIQWQNDRPIFTYNSSRLKWPVWNSHTVCYFISFYIFSQGRHIATIATRAVFNAPCVHISQWFKLWSWEDSLFEDSNLSASSSTSL